MLTSQFKKTYTITLPSSTSKAVVEWFEIMENNNELANELIELVYEKIKSRNPLEKPSSVTKGNADEVGTQEGQLMNPDCFFDSLYNWQDSSNEVFKEAKEVKKEKKKMLSV